jgi:hypothetical protein
MTNIVLMPLLPTKSPTPYLGFGTYRVDAWSKHVRGEIPFAEASISSWVCWSSINGIRFEVVRDMPNPEDCGCSRADIEKLLLFPPTIQRWLLPIAAFQKYGHDTSVALIDADTIVSPGAPSIFTEQHTASVNLTRNRAWNKWRDASCKVFSPLFPDVDFDKSMYFNTGVIVLNSPVLASRFIKFALAKSSEFLSILNGKVGTDQTPINYLVQQLQRAGELSASFLDRRWNVVVNTAIVDSVMVRSMLTNNFISHFIGTKELMPAVWKIVEELHPQNDSQNSE